MLPASQRLLRAKEVRHRSLRAPPHPFGWAGDNINRRIVAADGRVEETFHRGSWYADQELALPDGEIRLARVALQPWRAAERQSQEYMAIGSALCIEIAAGQVDNVVA